jgi:DNA-binding XRE family transcriptional regulator
MVCGQEGGRRRRADLRTGEGGRGGGLLSLLSSQSCPIVLPSDMKESPMAYWSNNLVTGRQLRAARTLAGMTQRDLATVLAVNERAVRFWERKHDRRPTSAPNDARFEQALLAHGLILFAEPTPGARLAEKP